MTLTATTRAPATGAGGGGIYFSAQSPLARFEGSIVAGNARPSTSAPARSELRRTARQLAPAGPTTAATSNRRPTAGSPATRTPTRCSPPELDTSAQPPVLAIPANSPAVDIAACGTRTVDQRGVARPQGSACDAGAYEVPGAVRPEPTPTATPVVDGDADPTPTPTP